MPKSLYRELRRRPAEPIVQRDRVEAGRGRRRHCKFGRVPIDGAIHCRQLDQRRTRVCRPQLQRGAHPPPRLLGGTVAGQQLTQQCRRHNRRPRKLGKLGPQVEVRRLCTVVAVACARNGSGPACALERDGAPYTSNGV